MSIVYLIEDLGVRPMDIVEFAKTITRGVYQINPDVLLFDARTKSAEEIIAWTQEHGDAVVMNYETGDRAWWQPLSKRPRDMEVVVLMVDTLPHFRCETVETENDG